MSARAKGAASYAGALWLTLVLAVSPAAAHQVMPSALALHLGPSAVDATLHLPADELGLALSVGWSDPALAQLGQTPERFDAPFRQRLRSYVADYLSLRDERGTAWPMTLGEPRWARESDVPFVVIDARWAPPDTHAPRTLIVHDEVIGEEVVSHRTFVSLVGGGDEAAATQVLGTLRFTGRELSIDGRRWPSASVPTTPRANVGDETARGALSMLGLGARHIAEGLDHLLFVFVLLLAAPLSVDARGKRWAAARPWRATARQLATLVTAFTLGHSLTLALGAVGWLRLPSAPVETLVAVSIALGALHAMRPAFASREAFVAGGFGLVHGLAFASTLEGFGLHGGGLALALGAFNVGIELVQLAVVAALAPLLVIAARQPGYTTLRLACATLALVAAGAWGLERVTGARTPLSEALDAAAAAPLTLGTTVWAALAAWVAAGLVARRTARRPTDIAAAPATASRD